MNVMSEQFLKPFLQRIFYQFLASVTVLEEKKALLNSSLQK